MSYNKKEKVGVDKNTLPYYATGHSMTSCISIAICCVELSI